jgi:hypothetical protein
MRKNLKTRTKSGNILVPKILISGTVREKPGRMDTSFKMDSAP